MLIELNNSQEPKEETSEHIESLDITHNAIDSDKLHIIKSKGAIPILEVELEGVNGLRIMWTGPNKTTIETKNDDDEWVKMTGVQKIEIIMSCDDPLPIVKINQLIIPGIRGKKITPIHIDEPREE